MRILVSGSTGLIGSRLVSFLSSEGHRVVRLVRSRSQVDEDKIYWDPYSELIEKDRLDDIGAVVHLSGEVIDGRWTGEKKERIRESRVVTTQFLSRTLKEMETPPAVLVCASAIGYYGDRGEEILNESSCVGSGFLAEVCREWELATGSAARGDVRVVNLRIGMVLSRDGGALKKMLLPFKIGMGGIIGSGKQYWSWIALEDVVGAIYHAMTTESLQGAVNAVAPGAVTNRGFTKVMGRVLSRPTLFTVPSFVTRMAFGEMADALLLASAHAKPSRLLETGYRFDFPELEGALRHLLERPG